MSEVDSPPIGIPHFPDYLSWWAERAWLTEFTEQQRQEIYAAARQLSAECGLDQQRVECILSQLAMDRLGQVHKRLTIGDAFQHALRRLPDEDALTLFERKDPRVLSDRDEFFIGLARSADLLCGLDELADLLEADLTHRYQNRDHLIATGWPSRRIPQTSPLRHLEALYPTKLPVEAFDDRSYKRRHNPNGHHNYTWSPVWAPLIVFNDGTFRQAVTSEEPYDLLTLDSAKRDLISPCSYEAAPFMPVITPERAAQVEAEREKLHRFCLEVVEACVSCLRARDRERLWPRVWNLLRRAFTERSLNEYLELDVAYLGLHKYGPLVAIRGVAWRAPVKEPVCGLVWELLSLVGHCEEELAANCMARMRRIMDDAAPGLAARLRCQIAEQRPGAISANHATEGYFAVAAELGYKRADALFAACAPRVQEALKFWQDLQRRVERELPRKLRMVEVPASAWVLPEQESTYRRLLGSLHDAAWSALQIGVPPPDLQIDGGRLGSPVALPPRPIVKQNLFEVGSKVCKFRFRGKESSCPSLKGFRFLRYVLEHRAVDCLDLLRPLDRAPAGAGPYLTASAEEAADPSLHSDPFGFRPDLTVDDREKMADAIEELKASREAAWDRGDGPKVAELTVTIEELERMQRHDFGIDGRPREDYTAAEKARKRVRRVILIAIARIREEDPDLADYLHKKGRGAEKGTVKFGRTVRYVGEEEWTF